VTPGDSVTKFYRSFTSADLVLYAGTNLHCLRDTSAALEQIGMMPVIGAGRRKQQPNVTSLAKLESRTAALLCDIFHGRFAEARFPSCTQANLAIFVALLNAGDTVLCLHAADGGHVSQNGDGMLGHLSVKLRSIPFDPEAQCMDDAATATLVRRSRPRLVVFGPSVVLRPSDMARTAAVCRETGAVLMVDVSHVAGLIAGGVFPNPLEHGADLISASSYKTLGCPPAGFIVGKTRSLQSRIAAAASPKLLSNYDAGRLLRFTDALASSRHALRPYAQAVVSNSASLSSALRDEGAPLLLAANELSSTHQVVVRMGNRAHASRTVSRLQEIGITTSLCGIPGRPGRWGIRLGTQLVTRRGMGASQMPGIAKLIVTAVRSRARASSRREVQQLAAAFRGVAFCAPPATHSRGGSHRHGE